MNFSSVLSWFSDAFSKFFTENSLLFIAKKTLYYGFLTITIPIVLKNVFGMLFTEIADVAASYLNSGTLTSAICNLTGLSAWLADKLMLQDCLAVLIGAMILKFKLKFIPFFK